MEDGKRSFTIEDSSVDVTGGRYISKTPAAAAKKAAHQLFKAKPGHKSIKIVIKETTSASAHKFYYYHAKKVMYSQPYPTRKIGDNIVTFKHEYVVESC